MMVIPIDKNSAFAVELFGDEPDILNFLTNKSMITPLNGEMNIAVDWIITKVLTRTPSNLLSIGKELFNHGKNAEKKDIDLKFTRDMYVSCVQ